MLQTIYQWMLIKELPPREGGKHFEKDSKTKPSESQLSPW